MTPWPLHTGVPNLGGPITTATGLTFIAATTDNDLRSFDTETRKELWSSRLPFAGHATPMTFRLKKNAKHRGYRCGRTAVVQEAGRCHHRLFALIDRGRLDVRFVIHRLPEAGQLEVNGAARAVLIAERPVLRDRVPGIERKLASE